jgi:SAM-dependent methyltransferase
MLGILEEIAARWRDYQATPIFETVAPHDAMFARGLPGATEHYMAVGRSAIEVICQAMITAHKTDIRTVLDLPCGAGRVTRHLAAFFPRAELYISDLDKAGECFVADNFGATAITATSDFSSPPPMRFDLIFVGSLLTHFDEPTFGTALKWFCQALAPDGLLIVTTHGRRADHIEANLHHHIGARWDRVREDCANSGFGFAATEERGGRSYGYSLSRPSWVLRAVEACTGVRILGYQEAAWADHQDVLSLQRHSLELPLAI